MPSEVTHGFLEGARPLFASYHAPTAPTRNIAWVVCQPMHYELVQCYRSMRLLAETLAGAGFHVLRVHYDGTGESLGATDFDPDRVAGWLESVRRAAAVVSGLPGVEGVGLVGVRLGGTLALETATRIDVARLVLWEPCAGAMYAREMEILAASSPQRVSAGGAAATAATGFVAGGFWYAPETLADLAKLDLEKMTPRGRPDVLLVQRDDRRPSPRLREHLGRSGCQATAVQLPGHKDMMLLPDRSKAPAAILAGIRDWAVARSGVVPEASPARPALAAEAVVSGLRSRAVRFGRGERLFGVLTEPAGGARAGLPAVLLLTGGVVPRMSGNGGYVTIAHRLASAGHAVLRMDVATIGESAGPDGAEGTGNDAFPPSIVEDARAGLARACAAAGPRASAWVFGLCSGAYSAFQTALEEPRVEGAILVNPVAFHLGEKSPDAPAEGAAATPATAADQIGQMRRYLSILKSPAAWKKLLTGKADVRHILGIVRARAASRAAAARERLGILLGRPPKGLAGELDGLLARKTAVAVVFSEGDPGHAALVSELAARMAPLVGAGLVVKVFAGADHNFHEMTSRAELVDWVAATITSRKAPG